jgi:hypothetical protein
MNIKMKKGAKHASFPCYGILKYSLVVVRFELLKLSLDTNPSTNQGRKMRTIPLRLENFPNIAPS